MKAIVIQKYGNPEVMEFSEVKNPEVRPGEILIRVAATSVNPIDLKRRSGEAQSFAPISFPGIIGVDVSGTVEKLGEGVKNFSVGDKVFAMANHTYAELCAVKAEQVAKIPDGLDLVKAAALPLVTTTGYQLIEKGAAVGRGQTILVTGAVGSVGRSAVFTAKSRGATVIAGVRTRQLDEAKKIGADQVIALDDEKAMAALLPVDAIADTVDGAIAEALIAKVKPGGIFASVLGSPDRAGQFPGVKVVAIYAEPDANALVKMAKAIQSRELIIPIGTQLPIQEAAKAHAIMARGGGGKILLTF